MSRPVQGFHWFVPSLVYQTAWCCAALAGVGEASDSVDLQHPPLPDVHLAPIKGFDNEESHLQSIRDRASQLTAEADHARNVMRRVDLLLAASNLKLARQFEPTCTRAVLGLVEPGDVADREALRSGLDEVGTSLDTVGKLLADVSEQNARDVDPTQEAHHRLEVLRAFEHALRAYFLPPAEAESARSRRQAASRLSGLLEDKNKQVVAAATLWHAVLREQSGDPSRAMGVLPLALSEPSADSLPFSFFSRVLRCRLIANRGGHAAALALLTQLEERCSGWFKDESQRGDALRTATLVELQILQAWHARLNEESQGVQREWCRGRSRSLMEKRFADNAGSVLRLDPAVPLVAPVPDMESPPSASLKDGGP